MEQNGNTKKEGLYFMRKKWEIEEEYRNILPEQQRTCAADAAGADTDPDGNGKRGSENRILHGMDETAGHGVGSYG